MGKKLNVAVLMGGNSPEHEISLLTGRQVVRHLNIKKYNVLPVTIAQDGISWQIGEREQFLLDSPTLKKTKGSNSKVK
ncbi:D-alanine--D-alanine ligase, partial [Burkholderia cenocepacia]